MECSYVNWLATSLAGLWGAGAAMMPIAGGQHTGTGLQEGLIAFALTTLTVGMIIASVMILWACVVRGQCQIGPETTAGSAGDQFVLYNGPTLFQPPRTVFGQQTLLRFFIQREIFRGQYIAPAPVCTLEEKAGTAAFE